ncbi:MAG: amino acid adenylation domain-containing protein [Pseudomonadota bacterium]
MATSDDIEDAFPLSPLQQGMLFHSVSSPASGVYIEQITARFQSEDFQAEVFQQCWQTIVERHQAFRSAFVWEKVENPLQGIKRTAKVSWELLDLGNVSRSDANQHLLDIKYQDRVRDFNLAKAPLMRMKLVRMPVGETHWIWTRHHLIADGWSTSIVLQELAELMSRNGKASTLKTPIPYKRYIAWLKDRSDIGGEKSFWRRHLAGVDSQDPPSCLTQHATTHRLGEFNELSVKLSSDATKALKTWCQNQRVTLNVSIQTAWAILLANHTQSSDLIWGATFSGRPVSLNGADQIVGLMINTLPVRLKLSITQSVAETVQRLQQIQLEMQNHENSGLLDIKRWNSISSDNPLFDSVVVFENYPRQFSGTQASERVTLPDLHYKEQSNLPVALVVLPGDELEFILIHDTDAISVESASRVLGQLNKIVNQLPASADASCMDVAIFPPEDKAFFEGAESDRQKRVFIPDATADALILEQARKSADRVALKDQTRQVTYSEMEALSAAGASRLEELAVQQHDHVAICVERNATAILWMLAVMRTGASYVIVDPDYPKGQVRQLLVQSCARVVISDGRLKSVLNEFSDSGFIDAECLYEPQSQKALSQVRESHSPSDTAYVLFTSGSSGAPKGVRISHRNLVYSTLSRVAMYPDHPASYLLMSSLSFDSSVAGIFWTLFTGGTLVLAKHRLEQDPEEWFSTLEAEKISHTLCLPRLYETLLEHVKLNDGFGRLDSVRCVITAGESMSATTMLANHRRFLPNARLFNEYGPTEATVWCSVYDASNHCESKPVPIGRPIPGTDIVILSPQGKRVPPGVIGEICIHSPGVSDGYINNSSETGLKFKKVPLLKDRTFYFSGDLGFWDEAGFLHFMGRADDQIKIRGHRIEPGYIESRIKQIFAVSTCAVIPYQSARTGQNQLLAAIESRTLSAESIATRLRDELPEYMMPAKIICESSLQTLGNDKIDRKRLLERVVHCESTTGHADAETAEESLLQTVWSDLLSMERIGIDDNYFTLGGDSITSIRIVSEVNRRGYRLSANDIFDAPTIRKLASRLEPAVHDKTEGLSKHEWQKAAQEQYGPDAECVLPLSPNQISFLFARLRAPENDPGHMQIQASLSGTLDLTRFNDAVNQSVRTFPALRTAIDGEQQDSPLQVTYRPKDFKLTADSIEPTNRMPQYLIEDRLSPLHIEEPQHWRIQFFSDHSDQFHLCFSAHHILIDGWSSAIVINNILRLYNRKDSEAESSAPALDSFHAFIRWRERQTWEIAREFWLEKSVAHAASRSQSEPIAAGESPQSTVRAEIKGNEYASLNRFAGLREITLAQMIQTVWARTLRQCSTTNHIGFALTTAGRNLPVPGIATAVGQFVNHLPMLLDIELSESLDRTAETIAAEARALRQHEGVSPSQIQTWTRLSPTTVLNLECRYYALSTLVMVENFPTDSTQGSNIKLRLESFQRRGESRQFVESSASAAFSMVLAAVPQSESLGLHLQYDTSLIDEETAENIVQSISTALAHWSSSDTANKLPQLPNLAHTLSAPIVRTKSRSVRMPENELQQELLSIWRALLKQDDISVDDSFFDLGGTSLVAVSLAEAIERQLGHRMPLSVLIRNDSIRRLSSVLPRAESAEWKTIVAIQDQGSRLPVFGIHAEGNVLFYRDLAENLGPEQPFYGLQSRELGGDVDPFDSIEEMAASYIAEIRQIQPAGPYTICGMCFGGWIAFEMAQQLIQQGDSIKALVVFDSGGPTRTVDDTRQNTLKTSLWSSPSVIKAAQHVSRFFLPAAQRQIKQVAQHHRLLKRNYVARHYPGSVTFIRSQQFQSDPRFDRHIRRWQAVADGGVDAHLVSGEHGNILEPPHVYGAAKIFRDLLHSSD